MVSGRMNPASRAMGKVSLPVVAAFLAAVSLVLLSTTVLADEAPLYEQEPYDTIKLDEANRNAELKVLPLDLPDRIVPAHPKPTDELEIHLIDRPKKSYQIAWESIVSITLFEQRVLDEAERLVEAKKLDEAFPYYEFLTRRYPKMQALGASYDKFLMAGAREAFKQEKYDECFALATDLFTRNADYPGVAVAILRAAEKLIDRRFSEEDFTAARSLVAQTSDRLKDRAAPLATTWNDKLRAKAAALVAEAKQHVQSNHYDLARRDVRLALAAWPDTEEAVALAAEIQLKYPEIVVGVTALAPENRPTTVASVFQAWETRRVLRLLARSIVEVERIAPQGPVYTSPLAKITRSDNGRRVFLDANPEIRWSSPEGQSSQRPLSAADLAAAIIGRGDRASPLYRPEWRELVANLVVEEPRKLRIELKHRAAHFEHLLNVPIASDEAWTVAGPSSVSLGPYRIESTDDKETRFNAVDGYFAAVPKEPKQIVERLYPDVASALAALRRGEITVVDRVGPWEAAAWSGSEKFIVEPCGPPSLHLLVPNLRRPAMQSALLRRAFAHAIDRSGILVDQLSRGRLPPGCELADRIFLSPAEAGTGAGSVIPEVRHDSATAKLLSGLAQSESVAAAGTGGDRSTAPASGLSLAYPPDETVRFACRAIEQQVRAAGIPLAIKELTRHEIAAGVVDADLIYVPWTPIEPLAELPGLVGSHGIGGDSGPLVERLIRDAITAEPDQATQRLGRLAQAIRDEMLVIPLWRLTNFVVYDRSLSGVGNQPVNLYQNVEHWQLSAPKGGER